MYNGHSRVINWNKRFIDLAEHISKWSKDPSTKVGAVITDNKKRIISVGYNGFAKGVMDTEERLNNRELKYPMIIHAEKNAILFSKQDLEGCNLYTYPLFMCCPCAALIIQSGIKKVIYLKSGENNDRWKEPIPLVKQMFWEAGVEILAI